MAVLELVFMGLWLGLRDMTHRRALDMLDCGLYAMELPAWGRIHPPSIPSFELAL